MSKKQKMTFKINEKLRDLVISLVTYATSLGIGFIIALFIKIPWYVSYPIFFVFGILAVAIDIPEERSKKLKYIPLLRRHFRMMHRVRMQIGIAAKEGKLRSAYKFVFGMFIIIVYLFFMNLAILSIKVILYYVLQNYGIEYTGDFNPSDPLRFTEAFLSLLGAGITAYIVWLTSFHREYKNVRIGFRKKTFKDTMRSVGKGFVLFFQLYILFISYIIWIVGEALFMMGTVFYPEFFIYLFSFAGGFLFILIISLIFIVILTKPYTSISTTLDEPETSLDDQSTQNLPLFLDLLSVRLKFLQD